MENLQNFKDFIIVNEDIRPMAFSDKQLCFCTHEMWEDEHFPLQTYTMVEAKKLIKKTINYRKKNNFPIGKYLLMPINLKSSG